MTPPLLPILQRSILCLCCLCIVCADGLLGVGGLADDSYDQVLNNLRNQNKAASEGGKASSTSTVKKESGAKDLFGNVTRSLQSSKASAGSRSTTSKQQAMNSTGKPGEIQLFGTVEFRGKIKKLPKWSGMLQKMRAWQGYINDPKTKGLKSQKSWSALYKKLSSASKMEQVKGVNSYFNKWPYRLDKGNYGVRDYWASPPEFLRKSGDCEDFAIAKFYGLKELGFTEQEMRVVALKDTIRNIGHAVLVVYLNDEALVLDNQTNMVLSHSRYKYYRPYYSVNSSYRWMHVPPMKKKK